MGIVCDYRERPVFEPLLPPGVTSFENLDAGDFHITSGDVTLVVERKTLADLAASLKDGRYAEQKARMLALAGGDPRRLAIIVEGVVFGQEPADTLIAGIRLGALRTMVLHAQHRDGIAVYTVAPDPAATAALVAHLADKLADPGEFFGNDATAPVTANYASLVRAKRGDNMTPRNVAVLQLCVIPRVSARVAEAILDAAGCDTLGQLCARLPSVERLAELRVPPSGRRLGAVLAKRVFEALSGGASACGPAPSARSAAQPGPSS